MKQVMNFEKKHSGLYYESFQNKKYLTHFLSSEN